MAIGAGIKTLASDVWGGAKGIRTSALNMAPNVKVAGPKLGGMFWMMSVPDAIMNVRNGDGYATGIGKAAATGLAWEMMPGMMLAFQAPELVGGLAKAGVKWYETSKANYRLSHYQGSLGGGYRDTEQAATMRQAAVQAIQGSRLNARSALGDEARLMHR